MRDRIRARLRELGADEAARATEGAFISTIHGFCARVLRAHALAAGIDPLFVVLDEPEAARLADAAFDEALEDLARNEPGGVDLIAAYTPRSAAQRRSRRCTTSCARAASSSRRCRRCRRSTSRARGGTRRAGGCARPQLSGELAGSTSPARPGREALERLARCPEALEERPRRCPGRVSSRGCRCPAATAPHCRRPRARPTARRSPGFGRLRAPLGAAGPRPAGAAAALLRRALRRRKRECSGLDFEDLELLARELLCAATPSCASATAGASRSDGRRAPGHQRGAARADRAGRAREPVHRRRRPAVDLRVPPRRRRAVRAPRRGGWRRSVRGPRCRPTSALGPRSCDVLNAAFEPLLGERFRPLRGGAGGSRRALDPRVELLIADKGADWDPDGLAAPWRLAEARALAARVARADRRRRRRAR